MLPAGPSASHEAGVRFGPWRAKAPYFVSGLVAPIEPIAICKREGSPSPKGDIVLTVGKPQASIVVRTPVAALRTFCQ